MNDVAIQVQNLSKRYRIGQAEPYKALRDVLTDAAAAPWRAVTGALGRRRAAGNRHAADQFWALKDVSFEIRRGEIVGIIGRNGAGKSTLLKILSRITKPTSGSAQICGRVGSLLEVGTGFHPELTGRENIYLNGAILGMTRAEIARKFDEIVDFAEIGPFLDTPVKRFSSGMYVRLAFAVAAHLEPEILIVDEVLAVGDAAFQKKCLGKMSDVAGAGRTVLFVSHNMALIQTLCQRGILLQQGSLSHDEAVDVAIATYLRNLEHVATADITQRTDRRGTGDVRLTRIEIFGGEADQRLSPATGQPLQLHFYVSKPGPSLACVFTIYDYLGQPIVNMSSDVRAPHDIISPHHSDMFICRFDELLLVPGRYRLNVAVSAGGHLQDHLEAAAVFDVEPGTLRGRPVTRDTGFGRISMPHSWIL